MAYGIVHHFPGGTIRLAADLSLLFVARGDGLSQTIPNGFPRGQTDLKTQFQPGDEVWVPSFTMDDKPRFLGPLNQKPDNKPLLIS